LQPDLLAKRIRNNLVSQKNKLEEYLKVLENEKDDINSNNADKLIEHINLEKNIIDDLNDFKKILEPLEKMYDDSPYKKDENLFKLKSSLEKLTNEVKLQSHDNKLKLDVVLDKVKADLKETTAKTRMFKNTYGEVSTRLVDLNG
jgi:hypothetical protein